MSSNRKIGLIVFGFITALFLVSQLVLGQLLAMGSQVMERAKLIKIHQHTGYTTVGLSLIYVGFSLATFASLPTRSKSL